MSTSTTNNNTLDYASSTFSRGNYSNYSYTVQHYPGQSISQFEDCLRTSPYYIAPYPSTNNETRYASTLIHSLTLSCRKAVNELELQTTVLYNHVCMVYESFDYEKQKTHYSGYELDYQIIMSRRFRDFQNFITFMTLVKSSNVTYFRVRREILSQFFALTSTSFMEEMDKSKLTPAQIKQYQYLYVAPQDDNDLMAYLTLRNEDIGKNLDLHNKYYNVLVKLEKQLKEGISCVSKPEGSDKEFFSSIIPPYVRTPGHSTLNPHRQRVPKKVALVVKEVPLDFSSFKRRTRHWRNRNPVSTNVEVVEAEDESVVHAAKILSGKRKLEVEEKADSTAES